MTMVLDNDEWALPPEDDQTPMETDEAYGQIRFTRNELLVLDYVLSTSSGLLLPEYLSDLVSTWDGLRQTVWQAIIRIERYPEEIGILISMNPIDARTLLAAVPTTMEWGDGVDCGYAVKLKLAQFREGSYEDDVAVTRREAKEKAITELANKTLKEAQDRETQRANAISNANSNVLSTKLVADSKKSEARGARDNHKAAKKLLETLEGGRGANDTNDTNEDQAKSSTTGEAGPTAE
jgi:hypothetical protein